MIHDPTDTNQSDDSNQQIEDDVLGQIDIESDSYHHLSLEQAITTTLTSSTILLWTIYQANKEIVLGMCAALIVFTAFIVTYIISKRKSRTLDKEPLVDNEFCVNIDANRLTIHV